MKIKPFSPAALAVCFFVDSVISLFFSTSRDYDYTSNYN